MLDFDQRSLTRREVLSRGVAAAVAGGCGLLPGAQVLASDAPQDAFAPLPPTFSVIPVVGDGKWIWTEPPEDDTGYLEPRKYEVKVGIEIEGTGTARQIKATTAAPVEQPGQEIDRHYVETQACRAAVRRLASGAGQLILAAPGIVKGQVIAAAAHFTLTLYKEHFGYEKEQFPADQKFDREFRKQYMYDSPGIQTRIDAVQELAEKLSYGIEHPWDKAVRFHEWVWENIKARVGEYTSVVEALRDRQGDCEERATVFIALCRVAGIPARQVWVPNHAWAEFCLHDEEGQPHWIPSHTSCYSWFGWTGAHELILQRGDKIYVPEKRKIFRLMADWLQWQGARPQVRYKAELRPLPSESDQDPGPGARRKDAKGQWVLIGDHQMDRFMRV